jgi:adenosylcobinamide-GDP ribazoletransferase
MGHPGLTSMRRAARALRLAFAFLTVLPLRSRDGQVTEADLAASRFAYPLVGLAIGLVLAGLSEALARLPAPPLLSAFLLVGTGVAITGGLHLDGLADTADGLFLWGDADRRLAAMRDPRLGSFGAMALTLALLGKFAALASLGGHRRGLALLVAAAAGRTLVLVSAGLARYARREGTGRILVEECTLREAQVAAALVVILGATLAGPGLAAAALALGLAWGLTRLADRRLGGVTGDTLGALVELGELAFLVVPGLS